MTINSGAINILLLTGCMQQTANNTIQPLWTSFIIINLKLTVDKQKFVITYM